MWDPMSSVGSPEVTQDKLKLTQVKLIQDVMKLMIIFLEIVTNYFSMPQAKLILMLMNSNVSVY